MAGRGLDHLQGLAEPLSAEDGSVIAVSGSFGVHPNQRIGNCYENLKEMGHDVDNPAGV